MNGMRISKIALVTLQSYHASMPVRFANREFAAFTIAGSLLSCALFHLLFIYLLVFVQLDVEYFIIAT